jgi:hypothetical protein
MVSVATLLVSIRTTSKRLLKLRNAFAKRVSLFDLVVHAASEGFNLFVDNLKAPVHLGKVLGDRCEFASAGIGKSLNKAIDVSEACFHTEGNLCKALIDAGESIADLLFYSIKTALKFGLLHISEVYHGADGGSTGAVESVSRILEGRTRWR